MYLRIPQRLHLELSNDCNAKCPMCERTNPEDLSSRVVSPTSLTFSIIKQQFEQLHFKEVKYCGSNGDPLMCREVLKICEFFEQRCDKHILKTNGSLRNKEFWTSLSRNNKLLVYWGIDGVNQESHQKYRVNTSLKKILNNAFTFNTNGGNSVWSMILFDHNIDQVEEAKDIARELGFKYFETIQSRRFRESNVFFYKNGTLKPVGDQLIMPQLNSSEIKCKAKLKEDVYIDSSGYVWPCTYLADDKIPRNNSHELNIYRSSFKDIIFNEFFDELNDSFKKNSYFACDMNCRFSWSNNHKMETL